MVSSLMPFHWKLLLMIQTHLRNISKHTYIVVHIYEWILRNIRMHCNQHNLFHYFIVLSDMWSIFENKKTNAFRQIRWKYLFFSITSFQKLYVYHQLISLSLFFIIFFSMFRIIVVWYEKSFIYSTLRTKTRENVVCIHYVLQCVSKYNNLNRKQ